MHQDEAAAREFCATLAAQSGKSFGSLEKNSNLVA